MKVIISFVLICLVFGSCDNSRRVLQSPHLSDDALILEVVIPNIYYVPKGGTSGGLICRMFYNGKEKVKIGRNDVAKSFTLYGQGGRQTYPYRLVMLEEGIEEAFPPEFTLVPGEWNTIFQVNLVDLLTEYEKNVALNNLVGGRWYWKDEKSHFYPLSPVHFTERSFQNTADFYFEFRFEGINYRSNRRGVIVHDY